MLAVEQHVYLARVRPRCRLELSSDSSSQILQPGEQRRI
jgi:hypothetical protein